MNLKEEIKKELEKEGNIENVIKNIVLKYKEDILKKIYKDDDNFKKELSEIKNVNSKDWYYIRGSFVQNNDLLLFIENSLKT